MEEAAQDIRLLDGGFLASFNTTSLAGEGMACRSVSGTEWAYVTILDKTTRDNG